MVGVKIFVSGDFSPVRGVEDYLLKDYERKKVFGKLSDVILNSDISITNLECPLTLGNKSIDKIGPNLKSDPKIANVLKETGFNLITLANNHIFDYGQEGLMETIKSLKSQGLDFVGAGTTLEEAKKTYYKTVKGVKIAFVNFAEIEFSCATENHGGANPMHTIENYHLIKIAKENADKVIVIIHGGHEHHHYPSPETMKRYRFYAEIGADVIIAHHTHCIGGYEVYNGVPIFYSLGNFLFPPSDKNYQQSWFEGYAVVLKINKEEMDFEIFPYEQCKNKRVSIKLKSKNSEIFNNILNISKELNEEKILRERWEKYVKEKRKNYFLGRMAGHNKYVAFILNRFGLLKYFINRDKLRFNKQIVSCQAHNETAVKILEDYLE